ncbi:MAG TPA: HAD-IIA family hydrolase [Clostridia bacterium]|jgi:NagD protein|nr:HAD-IIA family hydrolase [Clostridia bacterium]
MVDLKDIKVFLFDMDGTINMGEEPLEGAMETLDILTRKGKRVGFVTNNSSKSKFEYLDKIRRMGYEAKIEQIITSGMATAQYISRHLPYKSVYVLGTDALKREFQDYGIEVKELGEDADICVLAFDTEMTYEKLFHATNLIGKGRVYIATHPDFVCPSDKGDMPDAGAFMALIEMTNGKRPDVIIGKPCAPMAEFVFDHYSVNPKDVAFVGDRLYTDIKFGKNNKMTSILVLTGETTTEMLHSSDVLPDYVLESVNDLRIC